LRREEGGKGKEKNNKKEKIRKKLIIPVLKRRTAPGFDLKGGGSTQGDSYRKWYESLHHF
jgi:hypothetical protein